MIGDCPFALDSFACRKFENFDSFIAMLFIFYYLSLLFGNDGKILVVFGNANLESYTVLNFKPLFASYNLLLQIISSCLDSPIVTCFSKCICRMGNKWGIDHIHIVSQECCSTKVDSEGVCRNLWWRSS